MDELQILEIENYLLLQVVDLAVEDSSWVVHWLNILWSIVLNIKIMVEKLLNNSQKKAIIEAIDLYDNVYLPVLQVQ